MAESIRTSLRPIPKIAAVAALFAVAGFVFDPFGHPWSLVGILSIALVALTALWFTINYLERHMAIAELREQIGVIRVHLYDGPPVGPNQTAAYRREIQEREQEIDRLLSWKQK